MKRKVFFSILTIYIFLTQVVFAQNQDSIMFSNISWRIEKVEKGIEWKQANISQLFNSAQEINIIEIDLKLHARNLRLFALPSSREKTSVLAIRNKAKVAINGGFFDMKNGGAVDFIQVDGQVINHTHSKSKRANGYFAFNKKKTIIIADSSKITKYPNVMLSGPLLIQNKQMIALDKNAFNDNRHPRTAVALKGQKLLFITIDGRNSQANGMNLNELTQIMKWYGCDHLLNLDGGGSTTMYIDTQPESGVINYPSDNKLFDHKGERAVSNIIYIQ